MLSSPLYFHYPRSVWLERYLLNALRTKCKSGISLVKSDTFFFFFFSVLLYSLFKPNYDNTEERLRWQLPGIFMDYRCKLAEEESVTDNSQVHKYREHKTQGISQLFALSFHFKHMYITSLHFKLPLPILCDNG